MNHKTERLQVSHTTTILWTNMMQERITSLSIYGANNDKMWSSSKTCIENNTK